jgi:hypothetical protein
LSEELAAGTAADLASAQEVVETVSLAIYMGGGPAAVYAGMLCVLTINSTGTPNRESSGIDLRRE